MRVCIFTASIDKKDGGPSRSVPILARGLAEIGLSVSLMTLETDDMNTHLLNGTNVNLKVLRRNISMKGLESIVLKGNYDVIHAQNLWNLFYHKMSIIARQHNIPYIMTPRGTLEPWSLSQKKLKKKIALTLYQKKDLQKANCILATAPMEADHLRKLGITVPIAVIPNGIDVSEYGCRNIEFREKVKKQILFLSRIHEKKGIEILLNAWSRLAPRYPDWQVIIAGNGDSSYIEKLNGLLVLKRLNGVVKIIPPVFGDSKLRLYRESSLFVLPSYSENFGMVIAEAMACGVPVITTTGTPWEELNKKELGWCIELNEVNLVKALTDAIDLGEKKLFDKGLRCSKYINENYQYTEVAKCNKSVYEWIVTGKSKPRFVRIEV